MHRNGCPISGMSPADVMDKMTETKDQTEINRPLKMRNSGTLFESKSATNISMIILREYLEKTSRPGIKNWLADMNNAQTCHDMNKNYSGITMRLSARTRQRFYIRGIYHSLSRVFWLSYLVRKSSVISDNLRRVLAVRSATGRFSLELDDLKGNEVKRLFWAPCSYVCWISYPGLAGVPIPRLAEVLRCNVRREKIPFDHCESESVSATIIFAAQPITRVDGCKETL